MGDAPLRPLSHRRAARPQQRRHARHRGHGAPGARDGVLVAHRRAGVALERAAVRPLDRRRALRAPRRRHDRRHVHRRRGLREHRLRGRRVLRVQLRARVRRRGRQRRPAALAARARPRVQLRPERRRRGPQQRRPHRGRRVRHPQHVPLRGPHGRQGRLGRRGPAGRLSHGLLDPLRHQRHRRGRHRRRRQPRHRRVHEPVVRRRDQLARGLRGELRPAPPRGHAALRAVVPQRRQPGDRRPHVPPEQRGGLRRRRARRDRHDLPRSGRHDDVRLRRPHGRGARAAPRRHRARDLHPRDGAAPDPRGAAGHEPPGLSLHDPQRRRGRARARVHPAQRVVAAVLPPQRVGFGVGRERAARPRAAGHRPPRPPPRAQQRGGALGRHRAARDARHLRAARRHLRGHRHARRGRRRAGPRRAPRALRRLSPRARPDAPGDQLRRRAGGLAARHPHGRVLLGLERHRPRPHRSALRPPRERDRHAELPRHPPAHRRLAGHHHPSARAPLGLARRHQPRRDRRERRRRARPPRRDAGRRHRGATARRHDVGVSRPAALGAAGLQRRRGAAAQHVGPHALRGADRRPHERRGHRGGRGQRRGRVDLEPHRRGGQRLRLPRRRRRRRRRARRRADLDAVAAAAPLGGHRRAARVGACRSTSRRP